MKGAVYRWATDPKTGLDKKTATALQSLYDYVAKGRGMPDEIRRRWKRVNRLTKTGEVILDKDEVDMDRVSWILMGLEYEGKIERSVAK